MMINKHYEAVHRYDFLTKELLQEEYVANGLTDKQIAEKYSMPSKTVVWRKRKKFGIENKFKNKSNKNATKNRKFSITKEEAEQLLEEGKTFQEIAEHMGCSVLVSKRRFKELGLCSEQKQTSSYEYYDVELNSNQRQMVMGSLLGDGTITKSGAYSCSHSVKQKEYFDRKMKILYNLHSNCSQKYTQSHVLFKNDAESLHFTTGCNKYLYELRKIYYPNGNKIFPYEYLKDNLEADGLAYWYMDDGGLRKKRYPVFYIYGYSRKEAELFIAFFDEKFGIKTRLYAHNLEKEQYILFVQNVSAHSFLNLIRPHIIPSMLYKVDYEAYKKLGERLH
jgi:hypothetical protein